MVADYHLPEPAVNSPVIPVSGRHLAFNHDSLVVRAFCAADIYRGIKQPVELLMTQCAELCRVNSTYAWWAHKREAERLAIIRGLATATLRRSLTGTAMLTVTICR
jgi:hypothetical protein